MRELTKRTEAAVSAQGELNEAMQTGMLGIRQELSQLRAEIAAMRSAPANRTKGTEAPSTPEW